jgi:uncharacterized protein
VKVAYLDASAVVKLFKFEPQTPEIERALENRSVWVSSEMVSVEALCTARRLGGAQMLTRAERVLLNLERIPFDPAIRKRAGESFKPALRALDAIHAATALALGTELGVAFVYDSDLAAAMVAEGLEVESPGAS